MGHVGGMASRNISGQARENDGTVVVVTRRYQYNQVQI